MFERSTPTRRTVLKTAGLATVAAAVPAAAAGADTDESNKTTPWTAVETPTGNTLHDVADTAEGAYAVGGGGVAIRRTPAGWRKVFDGGPTGNGNNLYGADVTDDGKRLWVVGSSGAIGEYDVTTGVLVDRSAPNDVTNNFNDVAVTGAAGEANVYIGGDSGSIYYSFENGKTGSWNSDTPGSGSAINALDFYDERSGHVVDDNKVVFETSDGGTYEGIGIADANVNLYGVDSDGSGELWVAGGGGTIYEQTPAGWVPDSVNDTQLQDIEVAGTAGLAVGGGGDIYAFDGGKWEPSATPTGENLNAVVRGKPDIAVGAGGMVLEQ